MKWVKRVGMLVVMSAIAVPTGLFLIVRASLPDVEATVELGQLSAPVTVERDADGVATLTAETSLDLSRAIGFVHGQERFFQMDLMRRRAAGELAELVGAAALPLDRSHRTHRMRARARDAIDAASRSERALLEAYVAGVNAGLAALDTSPFEYWLLRQKPRPWSTEDSMLVVVSMYFELNDTDGHYESTLGLLRDVLPPDHAEFLSPWGTEWDAPIDGEPIAMAPVPTNIARPPAVDVSEAELEPSMRGSNNWAVSGARTEHGGALLANDMHLGHSVPNIWYRAMLVAGEDRAIGVTLPGVPFLVAGSNTHIAWGLTNSNGDWVDLVELEMHPEDDSKYRAADGWASVQTHEEVLRVAHAKPETLVVRETIWGPIVDADHNGTPRAAKWIAHEPGGLNITFGRLQTAQTLDEAIAIASRSGIPPQNFVVADDEGAIAWTIAGRIPRRFGFDGRRPSSWADGTRGWDGWLRSDEYPVIRDPEASVIWTANARVVSGEQLAKLGDGGYDLGARARQIRDGLLALENASEQDMLAIQLDERAIFMKAWRDFFLATIDNDALRRVIADEWNGRASTDSVGYRVVRELRVAVYGAVLTAMTADALDADARFSIWRQRQWEGPVWKLINEQPDHLLPSEYSSWNDWLNDIVNETVATWDEPLDSRSWGRARMSTIRHPLSNAVPFFSRWLDMPSRPLAGDSHMPRAQGPRQGASERLVVSPGREERGLFHMPGGQGGHPLSAYYGAGHDDWLEGRASPLLPGPTVTTLTLR